MKIHRRYNWGKTLCGLEGWRTLWGGWDKPNALPSTLDTKKVTCKNCLRKLAADK